MRELRLMKGAASLLLLFAFVPLAAATTVYRWVDANGVVHYSDRPHPGAARLDIEAPLLPSSAAPATTAGATAGPTGAQAATPPPRYALRILAPAAGTTLRPVNHRVRVVVEIRPPLAAGARIQYGLDGKPASSPTVATTWLLKKVYRGTHRLTVTVLAPDGQTAAAASAVFYVHQHSILLNRKNKPGPGGN